MQIRFTPRQIEAFLAIADVGSFNRAAERLNLSPSAVSGLIAELEQMLGFSLFERTTRRVALSGAGREFLPSAQSTMRQFRLAAAAAYDIAHRKVGVVRVAAPLVVASVVLPEAIATFRKSSPKIAVRLVDVPVDKLGTVISDGDADIAIGADRAPPAGVRCERLYPSPWVLWCARTHALASRRKITWAELRNVELVTAGRDHEQSVTQMTKDLPDDQRVAPTQIVDNMTTALGLAAAGLAVTVSPAYVAPLASRFGLTMRRIVGPEVIRHMSLYTPERWPMSPAAEGLATFLQRRLSAAH